jgi:hypothetical protein
VRKNPEILSPRTAWEWIFHHFRIPWNSPFFGLFWAFSGMPKKSRETLTSMFRFWFSWNVYRLRITRNQETRHIRSVHSGVCHRVHRVHIPPPPRPSPCYGTDVASWAAILFLIFLSLSLSIYILFCFIPSSWRRTFNRFVTRLLVNNTTNLIRIADGSFTNFLILITKTGNTKGVLVCLCSFLFVLSIKVLM